MMANQTVWESGFLGSLAPRAREKLGSLAQSFRFGAGEIIFREGDSSNYLYVVESGRVAIKVDVPSKGCHTILTTGPGEVFSWSALVGPRIATATAQAVEETEVIGFEGEALTNLCREDPALGFELYRRLTGVISARLNATRLQLLNIFT